MKKILNPERTDWNKYTERPMLASWALEDKVRGILNDVKENKDEALFKFCKQFDNVELETLSVSQTEIDLAKASVSTELKDAIELAYQNIYKFHDSQKLTSEVVETAEGVECWRKQLPIEKVGLYIPGGTAPLFSTILMLGIPAKIAGCKEVVLCTPCDNEGNINPSILYTADRVGVTKIFKIGGAQAVAAMAYGTESVPAVYKIFGPGNQFVTKAKECVQTDGIAIDMPAGPSEVLVMADDTCNPSFVAADLLSQAEHGADSQVVLVSNDQAVLDACVSELEKQLEELPRKGYADASISNSFAVLLEDIETCMDFSNAYAPEHLILASERADDWLPLIKAAGSVFIGNYSCESAGDYASGTNHTLPTNGFAKSFSGVSLNSFMNAVTFQKLSKKGIQNIGPSIEIMAEAEDLFAHKNAVTLRLKSLANEG